MTKIKSKVVVSQDVRAKDIMTTPVISVHIWDSIHEVAKLFLENNISGAPVVDMEGLPLGVITKTDLTRYDQEKAGLQTAEIDRRDLKTAKTKEPFNKKGFHVEAEEATIESWMTPFVFDVHPQTPLAAVTKKMLKNGLHHIFVTDRETRFIEGVITSFDLLQYLERLLNPKV